MASDSVITVLGPVPAASLGVTDAHEHLFLRSPAIPGQEIEDLDRTTAEVRAAARSGIGTIVEWTPIGLGRRPDLLRLLQALTGVNIVAVTGYHWDAHYPTGHWVHDASVELLAERVVADLTVGMHPHDWLDDAPSDPARAGAIKAGASYHRISPGEQRRLMAAAIGSRQTGVPVLVHTEIGTGGHEITDLLEREGVAPERIVLAHLDRNPDLEIHVELAARGVTLEYDTPGRTKYHPDSVLLDLIEGLIVAGHLDRLMLGLDLGRRDYFRAYGGGPGLTYLMDVFAPRLRRRIGAEAVERILVTNPARVYAVAEATVPHE